MLKKRVLEWVKTVVVVLLGNLLFALAMYTLVSPSGVVVGGVSGIGLTVERAFGFPAEWLVLPVNVAILIFGWIVLGWKMVVTSIASSILYPIFFALLRLIPSMQDVTQDALLSAILGGAGVGAAIGILMRVGASTGGTDIICLALNKWFHLPVSTFFLIVDFVVIFSQVFVSGLEMALYGLIYTAVETMVLNQVMVLGQSQIQLTVYSDEYEAIRTCMLSELRLGVTMFHVQTGYRGREQMVVICILHPRQLYTAQKRIHAIDPKAFFTVTPIKEVTGQGFTSARVEIPHGSGEA